MAKEKRTYSLKSFEVESFVNRRFSKGEWQIKVRWKGYSPKHDTWEPMENFPKDSEIWGPVHMSLEKELERKQQNLKELIEAQRALAYAPRRKTVKKSFLPSPSSSSSDSSLKRKAEVMLDIVVGISETKKRKIQPKKEDTSILICFPPKHAPHVEDDEWIDLSHDGEKEKELWVPPRKGPLTYRGVHPSLYPCDLEFVYE